MLLNDLVKLFASNFNINEERFIDIIDSNNIRLSQRLLVKIIDEKKIITSNTITNTTNTTNTASNIINDSNTKNNTDSEPKVSNKDPSTRGRGRPRKTKTFKEDDSVLMEVELIVLENKEYYKTPENVILTKELEIEGILKDGKILRRVLSEPM